MDPDSTGSKDPDRGRPNGTQKRKKNLNFSTYRWLLWSFNILFEVFLSKILP